MPLRLKSPGPGLRVGKVFGIPIYLHSSWFIIFALITYSLATQFTAQHPTWRPEQHWALGVIASLLFFASVLIHELGHSVIALRYKIPVASITLFVFGGLARITREPDRAMQEFNIAIAGPITSFLLAGLFFAASRAAAAPEMLQSAFGWLAEMNFVLAVFNLVPGFPLDGGRILRSVAWGITKDFTRASRTASRGGQWAAYLMIAWGVTQAIRGNVVGGVWIGFIGWFLLSAAQQSLAQVAVHGSLQGLRASDVMSTDVPVVPGGMSLEEYVQEVLRTGRQFHIVGVTGHPTGIVTLQAVQRFPREEWPSMSVQAAMLPTDAVHRASPSESVAGVLERMQRGDVNQMPVMNGDELVGLITRDSILRVIQAHSDAGHVVGQ